MTGSEYTPSRNIQDCSMITRFRRCEESIKQIPFRAQNDSKKRNTSAVIHIESAEAQTIDVLPVMCPVDSSTGTVQCKTNRYRDVFETVSIFGELINKK